jgi:hypothetical protein
VRIDDRHRFSVRASTVGRDGQLRAYRLPAATLPDGLRAVVGEEQTDVVSLRTDKVDGLATLLRRLGTDVPVLAVGDTASDVGMLRWARNSVVPRHADAAAKAAAGRVAARPYQLGLADAIGTLIGHRPGECARCAPPTTSPETRTMLQLLRLPEGSRLQALTRSVPLLRQERQKERCERV